MCELGQYGPACWPGARVRVTSRKVAGVRLDVPPTGYTGSTRGVLMQLLEMFDLETLS